MFQNTYYGSGQSSTRYLFIVSLLITEYKACLQTGACQFWRLFLVTWQLLSQTHSLWSVPAVILLPTLYSVCRTRSCWAFVSVFFCPPSISFSFLKISSTSQIFHIPFQWLFSLLSVAQPKSLSDKVINVKFCLPSCLIVVVLNPPIVFYRVCASVCRYVCA